MYRIGETLPKSVSKEYFFLFYNLDTARMVTTRWYASNTDFGWKNHTEKKKKKIRSKNLSCLSQELTSLRSLMSLSLSASCRCLHHGVAALLPTCCNVSYTDLLPRYSSCFTQHCFLLFSFFYCFFVLVLVFCVLLFHFGFSLLCVAFSFWS